MADVRVTGFQYNPRKMVVEEYGFIGESLGTDERTGQEIVLHPIHGRQVVRDDETAECVHVPADVAHACQRCASNVAPVLAVPSDLCSLCGLRGDEAHHGRCIVEAAENRECGGCGAEPGEECRVGCLGVAALQDEWDDTGTDLMTGQITVAVPGEQMELR